MKKSEIVNPLLRELDRIDARREHGTITKREHDSLSRKAVKKALEKL